MNGSSSRSGPPEPPPGPPRKRRTRARTGDEAPAQPAAEPPAAAPKKRAVRRRAETRPEPPPEPANVEPAIEVQPPAPPVTAPPAPEVAAAPRRRGIGARRRSIHASVPEPQAAPEPTPEASGLAAMTPLEPISESLVAPPVVVGHRNRRQRRAGRRRSTVFQDLPDMPAEEMTEMQQVADADEAVAVEPPAPLFAVIGTPDRDAPIAVEETPQPVEAEPETPPPAPAAVSATPAAERIVPRWTPSPVVLLPLEDSEPESSVDPECPACGEPHSRLLFQATDRLYRTTGKVFQILECKQCRLIRLEPRPTPRELSRYYPERYWFTPSGGLGRLEEAYRRLVLRDHISFVRQALDNSDGDGYLVDVGCGNGLLLSLIPYSKILGLDVSTKALSIAWKQNGVPGACADLSDVPLRSGTCSVITMFHVIEHLSNPVRYLEAARELLTPRGRLVVQVPNASCWQFMLFGQNWNGIDVPRHLFNYRQRDIENLLSFCGFEVTRRKHFSLRDNPAGMASSLAPALDPMARRVRRLNENVVVKALKDSIYFGLVLAALPFTAVEAACGCGSTIMIEARRKT